MEKRDGLTRALACVGTGLLWLPIVLPFAFAAVRLVQGGRLLFDYLIPAELFPVALAGGVLLIWAAVRARAYRGLICGGMAGAAGLFVGMQVLAVATGLASGEKEAAGWPWVLVLACLAAFWLALVATGVGGVLLLRRLFRRHGVPAAG